MKLKNLLVIFCLALSSCGGGEPTTDEKEALKTLSFEPIDEEIPPYLTQARLLYDPYKGMTFGFEIVIEGEILTLSYDNECFSVPELYGFVSLINEEPYRSSIEMDAVVISLDDCNANTSIKYDISGLLDQIREIFDTETGVVEINFPTVAEMGSLEFDTIEF